MDYSNFAPHPQPYQFFVPTKAGPPYTTQEEHHYDSFDAFSHPNTYNQFFDQNAHFPQASIIQPPAPAQSPTHSLQRPSISHAPPALTQEHSTPLPPGDMNNNGHNPASLELDYDQGQGRSSEDEKESLTPAQSRRKAQNRAAQRAFRERKERHVKDLELKLKSMEARSTDLLTDNERLKRELDRIATQNEILRATSSSSGTHGALHRSSSSNSRHQQQHPHPDFHVPAPDDPDQDQHFPDDPSTITPGPLVYSPRTFNAAFADHVPGGSANDSGDGSYPMIHRIAVNAATGERLLSTGAAWEYIQNSELFQKGVVDLGEVVDRLRERVVCDGAGPSFLESEVRSAIEESMGAVGDELI